MLICNGEADPQSSFKDAKGPDSCNKAEREVRLEPDEGVSGALAFRLAGNRTRGVFIRHVNQKSEQVLHCWGSMLIYLTKKTAFKHENGGS